MMDDLLVPVRRFPDAIRRNEYLARLVELGCEDTPCFNQRNVILRFPEYSVTYRGDRLRCESHIKNGGVVDPRQMFRIYYHWHEQDEVLIVGHLPSHLDNNQTN